MTDLNKGAEYYFRVRAKNNVGISEATQTPHPVVAKEDIVKPDIDLHDLYQGSLSSKAGTNIKVKLPLLGKFELKRFS